MTHSAAQGTSLATPDGAMRLVLLTLVLALCHPGAAQAKPVGFVAVKRRLVTTPVRVVRKAPVRRWNTAFRKTRLARWLHKKTRRAKTFTSGYRRKVESLSGRLYDQLPLVELAVLGEKLVLSRRDRRILSKAVRRELAAAGVAEPKAEAEGVMRRFEQALPEARKLIRADLRQALTEDPALWMTPNRPGAKRPSRREVIAMYAAAYPGARASSMHRIAHALHTAGAPLVARIMSELVHSRTGIDIHPGATIGGGLFIDHGTGLVIGATAIIGKKLTVLHGVTIGAKNYPLRSDGSFDADSQRHPTLGDNVTIGANGVILGRTRVKDGATVGAQTYVRTHVRAGRTVFNDTPKLLGNERERQPDKALATD